MAKKKNPYDTAEFRQREASMVVARRIIKARVTGKGVRLTHEEVSALVYEIDEVLFELSSSDWQK